jgi:outer membrane protein OmpA-like peptidoglycan-associated protein
VIEPEVTLRESIIDEPSQNFVSAARATALAPPRPLTALERAELSWARNNPDGRSDNPSDHELVLWNFDVARATLKEAHIDALRRFIGLYFLSPQAAPIAFKVVGHASRSGSSRENDEIAQRRAQAVANWLIQAGFSNVTTEALGAREPRDPGDDGAALARNRRVNVTLIGPVLSAAPQAAPEFVVPERIPRWEPAEAGRPEEQLPGIPGIAFESTPIEIPLGTWTQVVGKFDFVISGKVEAKIKVTVADPNARLVITAQLKNGKLNQVIEGAVHDWVKAKLTLEEPGKGEHWAGGVKGGIQFDKLPLKPEVGLQNKVQFVYVSFALPFLPLDKIRVSGVEVSLQLTAAKIKFEIGPGERSVAALTAFATEAGAPAVAAAAPYAVAAGVILVALTITVGTASSVEYAKEEGVRRAQVLAIRDAFASRVALEVTGPAGREALVDRINEWRRFPDERVRAAAARSYKRADDQLAALTQAKQLQERVQAWTVRYGRDLDFTAVRERMFHALGGYGDTEGTDPDLSQL